MENAQIIHILDIPFLEIQRQAESLREKVQRVEGFSLRFCDGWDVGATRESQEARKAAAGILDHDSLWRCCSAWRVVKQWFTGIWLVWISIPFM